MKCIENFSKPAPPTRQEINFLRGTELMHFVITMKWKAHLSQDENQVKHSFPCLRPWLSFPAHLVPG